MSHTINELLDQNGNYDINRGYKYISTRYACYALTLISSQLDYIKNSQCVQSNRQDYSVQSHSKPFDDAKYQKRKNKQPFRKEEWICKRCKGQVYNSVGEIIDYQVPLKHSQECSGWGKVDLLSLKDSVAYLLEVKVYKSTEVPLRAIMEIYTYWKQLGGNEGRHFLTHHSALRNATTLKKGIVLFEGSRIHKKLLEPDNKPLWTLMRELEVECFLAKSTSGGDDFIEDIVECRL